MTYGFKIVQEMISGLSQYLDEKEMALSDLVGRAVPNFVEWQDLNLNYVTKARIDQDALHQVRALLCRLRGHQPPGDRHVARPGVRGDGRRMRGLQPLRQRLPGGDCITMEELSPMRSRRARRSVCGR
jgi:hypothetical protein